MRRLAELLKTSYQDPTRRAGTRMALFSLLVAFTLFTLTPFVHAQTTRVATDFEDGQMGVWVKTGNPTTFEVSTDMAHTGTHSLKVAGRSSGDDGPAIDLLPIMKPGESWEFSVWVRLAPGADPDTIILKMHDTANPDWGGYRPIANEDQGLVVTDKAWVQLKGRYPGSGTLNAGATELKTWLASGSATTNFYVDDFVAWKQAPSGCYSTADTTGDTSDFETELNWAPRGWSGVTLSLTNADKHSGSQSLLESNRGDSWKTAAYVATGKMCNGSSYKVSVWVKMAPGMPAADMFLQADAAKAGVGDKYITLSPTVTVTDQAWVELTGNYDMWTDYDTLSIWVQPKTDKTSSFYVDDFSLQYVPLNQAVENIPGIGAAYKTYFPVGAAVYGRDVTPGDVHADLLAKHFTSVTAENDMKWSATESTEGNFDFAKAQAIVDFAKANGMAVRGHTLIWDQQTPDWVFQDPNDSTQPAPKAVLQDRMKKHIEALISHFGADVTSWDVVNEAFDESQADGFRHGKWYNTYGGPGYIDDAFNYAHQALVDAGLNGKVKLYLNEYNTTIATKLAFITSYLTAAKTNGVPIDGIGHQFHNKLDWPVNDDPTSINAVTNAIDSVAKLGFDNQVTEMDISIYRNLKQPTTYESYADVANLQNDLVIQGIRYNDYFSAFKTLASAGKLSSVTLWGQADDHTWLSSTTTADAPLPFDKTLAHKPAYTGIMDATSLPNALPHAYDADVKVTFNTATAITLPGSDANHDALTFSIGTQPPNGALGAVSGNKVTYTPTTGYFGTDSFTYTANDGKGDSNVGTINVTVLPLPPVATDQTVAVDINTPEAITLAVTGDGTMTYTIVTQPTHGTLSGTAPNLTYTPASDYTGTDSFTFKANNGTDSNTATVTLNVALEPPVAADQSVTTAFNTDAPITLSATGQGTLTYSIVAQPAHGTLTGAAPNVTFKPNTGYWGTDSFTFKANNGSDSNVAKVSINVQPAAPVAVDQTVTVDYARPQTITLTANGNVLNNGTMTFTIVSTPSYKGTSRGTLVAVPASTKCSANSCSTDYTYTAIIDNFGDPYLQGTDTEKAVFTFKASNGHDSNTATVSITVKPAALKVGPVAGQPTSATVNAGDSASFNLQVAGFLSYSRVETAPTTFVCGNLPANATCVVTPLQVSLDDNMTPAPFKVTVYTKNSSGTVAAASTSVPGSGPSMPWLPLCALAGFALVFVAMRRSKMQWRMVGASAALLFTMSLTACGGHSFDASKNSNTVATPAGTYTVTVTAVATHTVGANQNISDWKVTGDAPLTLTVK